MSWFPGISQLKSGFQLITGDVDGTLQTQKEFLQRCPGVSQVTSVIQVIAGDAEGARETQRQCFSNLGNVANAVPVVGHVKGVVHMLCEDEEGASKAFVAANRSTVVMGTGAVGGLLGGPVGAIGAGIAAGVALDTIHSVAVNEERGIIAAIDSVANSDKKGGAIFDLALVVVGDGLVGNAGFEVTTAIQNMVAEVPVSADAAAASQLEGLGEQHLDLFEKAADGKITSQQYLDLSKQLQEQALNEGLVPKAVASKPPAVVESIVETIATPKEHQENPVPPRNQEEIRKNELLHSDGSQGSTVPATKQEEIRKNPANDVRKRVKSSQASPTKHSPSARETSLSQLLTLSNSVKLAIKAI